MPNETTPPPVDPVVQKLGEVLVQKHRNGRVDSFESELAALLNKYSLESGSDTPDFILAGYLFDCLKIWDTAVAARMRWYQPEAPTLNERGRLEPFIEDK